MSKQFGPYTLVRQIAVGGMAEIHLAKTSGIAGFEKYVALKMIHPNFSEDQQFIQMLIDEAKLTVQLQHVNIAQTFDLGRVDDTYYITMEFVDGADLYKLLRKGSERGMDVPIPVAAYIAKEVAAGLDYAHRKRDIQGRALGIVHRDVSPQNVLISTAGEVKIVDFGIAKATMRARQTAVGVIKGKYYYMSPEQAWGDKVDHRTDIFSNGILLYEMLAGQMLYLEEDLHKLLDLVRKANIEPVKTLRQDTPPQLERIVAQALANDRENRYQTASQLASDLERFLHAYAPVFTASKIAAWMKDVLQEEPPPLAAGDDASLSEQAHPSLVTKDQLLVSRKEFTDENSVIFNINELMARSARDASEHTRASAIALDTGEHTLPDPIASVSKKKRSARAKPPPLPSLPGLNPRSSLKRPAREINMATQAFGGDLDTGTKELDVSDLVPAGPGDLGVVPGLGDEDDRTEISISPGFLPDGGTTAAGDVGDDTNVNELDGDKTVGEDTDVDEVDDDTNVQTRAAPTGFDSPIGEETIDGPTLVRDAGPSREKRKGSSDLSSPASGRSDTPTSIDPEPARKPNLPRGPSDRPWEAVPSLAASNPKPAISALRTPRKSRRTPPDGIPAQNPPVSVLSSLLTDQPGPRVPQVAMSKPSVPQSQQMPAQPPPGSQQMPAQPPPGSQQIPAQPPPGSQQMPAQPPVPSAPQSDGAAFPGPPDTMPTGDVAMPGGAQPTPGRLPLLEAFPTGIPPASLTKQLQAIELDEIPDHFKLSRTGGNRRMLLWGGLVFAVLVTAGILVGVLGVRDQGAITIPSAIEIVSSPEGATVSVDGTTLPAKTPTRFENAEAAGRYLIVIELRRYQRWEREVSIPKDGGVIKLIARLELVLVTLKVKSDPPGAEVFVNRKSMGRTPVELAELDPALTKTIELRKKGYRPIRVTLEWKDDETDKTLSYELKK